MEKKMETTGIVACIGIIRVHIWIIRVILGLYSGNGKENGN